jgi:hypothetical protein
MSSSHTTPAAPLKTERFRNWTLIGLEIIVTALAALAFLAWEPGLPGWVGLAAGLLIVWPLSREFLGVAIGSRGISLPRGRLTKFPIVSLGRRLETGATPLRELMVMEPWYGFQVVEIEGWFGSEVLVFQSRAQRLRFMSAFEKTYPTVPIYRKSRPKKQRPSTRKT